jgi:murein L,D-transpeptidase YcbB/YkuD
MPPVARRLLLAGLAALPVARPGRGAAAIPAGIAQALRARLARAAEDGLDPAHYAAPDEPSLLAEAVGRFAHDLGFGRVQDPAGRPDIQRSLAPTSAALAQLVLAATDPLAELDALAPADPLALALKAALAAMPAEWPAFTPTGTTLTPGARGPQVAQLRARLAATDPVLPPSRDPDLYDPVLADAARRFQAAHGLHPDARLGRFSQALLAETAAERRARLAANLDARRGLLPLPPDLAIEVNVPAFSFQATEHGAEVLAMRVVVGRPTRPTPMMLTRMTSAVFNPPWGVPQTLAREDFLPRLRADPASVTARGFRIFGAGGVEIDPTTVDWRSIRPDRFPFVIRQDPGDANALGRIKFNLVNDQDIYMHDTPDRRYFATDVRAFSSGCIRLEKPAEMVDLLFAGQPGMDRARMQALLDRRTTSGMTARRAIPVKLAYRTATLGPTGQLVLRHDLYGLDAAYARAMARPAARAA